MKQFHQSIDSANPLAVHLDLLSDRGWTCETPRHRFSIAGTDKKQYSCVCCEGLLFGVPRAIFLSANCGRVMLIGETKDVPFDEFLKWLGLDDDPAFASSEPVALRGRQKSLFGGDDD